MEILRFQAAWKTYHEHLNKIYVPETCSCLKYEALRTKWLELQAHAASSTSGSLKKLGRFAAKARTNDINTPRRTSCKNHRSTSRPAA